MNLLSRTFTASHLAASVMKYILGIASFLVAIVIDPFLREHRGGLGTLAIAAEETEQCERRLESEDPSQLTPAEVRLSSSSQQ